jgi:hypothetical protein
MRPISYIVCSCQAMAMVKVMVMVMVKKVSMAFMVTILGKNVPKHTAQHKSCSKTYALKFNTK